MRLSQYMKRDLVLTGVTGKDAPDVIGTLARHLASKGVVASADSVRDALLEREENHTTAIGEGIALPHATVEGIDEPVLMIALAPEPIQFGPEGTEPVRVFFVLLSTPAQTSQHIKILARICRLARHASFVPLMTAATTSEQAADVIEQVDQQHV